MVLTVTAGPVQVFPLQPDLSGGLRINTLMHRTVI